MPTKPQAPSKSKKKAAAVKEKKRRVHKRIEALPPFPPYIRGEKNPLIGNKHAKRPLVIALARKIKDDDELCEAVRYSGCLYVIGSSNTNIDETPIKRNEWSGKGYAMRTGRAKQANYQYDHKIQMCEAFVNALITSLDEETIDKDIEEGRKLWEEKRSEYNKQEGDNGTEAS